jgi:uncharacterized cupredoxin-like copper-binding protein
MSSVQEPPTAHEPTAGEVDSPTATELGKLRHELREQGRSIRETQHAFSIFAVMALVISMASLLAVTFKLQRHPQSMTVQSVPAVAAPAAATPLPRHVDVTLAQFSVMPSDPAAAAGRVTFRVHNAGTITHEFVVIRTPVLASDLPLKGGRAVESGNVGETGDLKPGATSSVGIKLTAGHYALICNLPGHYLAGQHTDFTVR